MSQAQIKAAATRDAAVAAPREVFRLGDLPAPPKTMNVLGVVLMYTLYGLHDDDICVICGLDDDRLARIRNNHAYGAMKRMLYDAVVASDADPINAAIRDSAPVAVEAIKSAMSSQSEWIRLAAAKDVLDRGGYVQKNITLHQHHHTGGLRIEYVDKTDKLKDVTMEIQP